MGFFSPQFLEEGFGLALALKSDSGGYGAGKKRRDSNCVGGNGDGWLANRGLAALFANKGGHKKEARG